MVNLLPLTVKLQRHLIHNFLILAQALVKNYHKVKLHSVVITPSQDKFMFKEIKFSAVFKILSSVKESKTAGLDKISAKLVKDTESIIAPSLTIIFNKSLTYGIFQMIGKMLGYHQFSKLEIRQTVQITDRSQFYP